MKSIEADKIVLALMALDGIGRKTVRRIGEGVSLDAFALMDLSAVVSAAKEQHLLRTGYSDSQIREAIDSVTNLGDQHVESQIAFSSFLNPAFPPYLNRIDDPPAALFFRGNLDLLDNETNIAVVGTREPTEYAQKVGERLVEILVERGYNIVSGLALGCDSIAHRAALKYHGKTIAVLPSGLFSIYPKSHQLLSEQIVEEGGLLVTEYLPNATPQKSSFVERDRLQSALSKALVVLETDVKGGTMHTVRYARGQSRQIACLLTHPSSFLVHPKLQGNLLIEREQWGIGSRSKSDLESFLSSLRLTAALTASVEIGLTAQSAQEDVQSDKKSTAEKSKRKRKKKGSSTDEMQIILPF